MDRIRFFQLIIFAIVALIIARLFYWQFIAKIEREPAADTQDLIPAARGEIFASDGFPLATNQEAFLVFAKPREIKKPQEVAKTIAPFLISEKYATQSAVLSDDEIKTKDQEIAKKENDISSVLKDPNLFWVQLARKVPLDIKNKIESQKIEGLGFARDDKRFYPEASMAARLLGFVGSDKFGQDTGYFGLEGYYDRKLRGTPGRGASETDPFGLPILIGKYRPISPKKGSSLYLTLDRSIQFLVEDKLKQAVERYGAKDGTAIVMDPKTGRILAMATVPSYDPAHFSLFDSTLYKNLAVADTYEPGSTFKLVAMSAALDSGAVTPGTKCDVCSGSRQIGGFEISTWNKKYFPDSTMVEVIEHSDNVGMTFVADKLGLGRLYNYIIKFGFGQPSGIDLQEEASGFIRPQKDWRIIDLATASFGQGIAVTPIQMLQATATIANGGKLVSPKIVAKIVDASGHEEKVKADERQVISPKAAAQMTEMMVNAVEFGEARVFAPQGFRIAGKTGTAQIPVAGHYDPNKTIASFVGFAPASDPKFAMLVRFTEPSSSQFGSETAAPTFFAIAKDLFNYYGILPSGDQN